MLFWPGIAGVRYPRKACLKLLCATASTRPKYLLCTSPARYALLLFHAAGPVNIYDSLIP